jgi:outer membrane protein TolC
MELGGTGKTGKAGVWGKGNLGKLGQVYQGSSGCAQNAGESDCIENSGNVDTTGKAFVGPFTLWGPVPMKKSFRAWVCLLTAASLSTQGCRTSGVGETAYQPIEAQVSEVPSSIDIDEPNVETQDPYSLAATVQPISIADEREPEYWDLSLQQSIEMALARSEVMRDLGGQILRSPLTIRTVQDPAITETDPRFGVDAALSQFDAQFSSAALVQNNDRAINNVFAGGGTRILQQDFSSFITGLSKRAATGAEFTVRNNTEYDANNSPGNEFPSVWNTNIETVVRQPLLQGGGVDFNRIYGPNGSPGLPSGVLLARVNTDQSVADFELGVRNFVSDVENAYWDLYFAYHDLDARKEARDSAFTTWERLQARKDVDSAQIAQVKEQYFRFQEEVQNSLTGKLIEGTRSNSGTSGGVFRGTAGVQVAERRLRLMLGLPISDGRLLRPTEQPEVVPVRFDWSMTLAESLARRPELRRQKWLIKRRELEILGARNFTLPRLDAIGLYRWRGYGKDLMDQGMDRGEFDNAWGNLLGGGFQEWQVGAEFSVPLGLRRGHATVRNAELLLARDRAILAEQERNVVLDLSNAIAEVDRAYAAMQTNLDRLQAAEEYQLRSTERLGRAGDQYVSNVITTLEAQRRVADAASQYHRSVAEYEVAIKNVHLEKGSLLEYNSVSLAEGAWPVKAYNDALVRIRLSQPMSDRAVERLAPANIVSEGPAPQRFGSGPSLPARTAPSELVAPGELTPNVYTPPSPDGEGAAR